LIRLGVYGLPGFSEAPVAIARSDRAAHSRRSLRQAQWLVSLLLSAVLAALAKYVNGVLPVPAVLLESLDFLVSLFFITLLFAMIFKLLPRVAVAWTDVWVGAALTSLLFTAGKFLIGFYIGKSVSASAYGAAGSLVIVVAWIYYSALLLYFGAEFTRIYANNIGSRRGQYAT
jgi:membrane protein